MLKDYWDPFLQGEFFWKQWRKEGLKETPDKEIEQMKQFLELVGIEKEKLKEPILSVGSGSGRGYLQLKFWRMDCRIISLDVYLEPLMYIPLEDPKVQADVKELPFKNEIFYLVIGDSLLDIPNRKSLFGESLDYWLKQRWLEEISRVIKKEGYFLHHGGTIEDVGLRGQENQCGFRKIFSARSEDQIIWIYAK